MPFKTIMVLLNDSSRTEQLLDAASALETLMHIS